MTRNYTISQLDNVLSVLKLFPAETKITATGINALGSYVIITQGIETFAATHNFKLFKEGRCDKPGTLMFFHGWLQGVELLQIERVKEI